MRWKIHLVAAAALSLGWSLVGVSSTDAAPAAVALGDDTWVRAPFDDCLPNEDGTLGGIARARCDAAAGLIGLDVLSQGAGFPVFTGQTAQSDASMWRTFRVERGCASQRQGPLTGDAFAEYSYKGRLWKSEPDAVAIAQFHFGIGRDTVSKDHEESAPGVGYRDVASNGRISGPRQFVAGLTTELSPTFKATIAAIAEGFAPYIQAGVDFNRLAENESWIWFGGVKLDWIDDSPPGISATVESSGTGNGWYRSPATVVLSPSDPESCTEEFPVRIDGALKNPPHTPGYDETPLRVIFSSSGPHQVRYSATNFAGTQGPEETFAIQVDGLAPQTLASKSTCPDADHDGKCEDRAQIDLDCDDTHSGCARTLYRVDGRPWTDGDTIVIVERGDHVVEYYSIDQVGNEERSRSISVSVECGGDLRDAGDLTGVCVSLYSGNHTNGCAGYHSDSRWTSSCEFLYTGGDIWISGEAFQPSARLAHVLVQVIEKSTGKVIGGWPTACDFRDGILAAVCVANVGTTTPRNHLECRVWSEGAGTYSCFGDMGPG